MTEDRQQQSHQSAEGAHQSAESTHQSPESTHQSSEAARGLDPRVAMALADQAGAQTRMALFPYTPTLYLIWGTVWLLGYGALHGAQHGWLPLQEWQALLVLFACLLIGMVVSAVLGIRSSLGIRGASSTQGAIYGWSWALAFGVVGLLSGVIADSIDDGPLRGLIINAVSILVVGLMYLVGGALWRDLAMSIMGAWFLVVNIVALVLGPEYYLTVFLTLGVLGFYAGTAVEILRRQRLKRDGR